MLTKRWRGYTNWSAYASFREDETGIIQKGRWADLTVMDLDPFRLADDSSWRYSQRPYIDDDSCWQGCVRTRLTAGGLNTANPHC